MAEKSYNQIVKSTSITGISQSIQIGIKIIGTKSISVFIGPAGVGLLGILQSTIDLIGSIINVGLGASAVYDISVAKKNNDIDKISIIIRVLFRLVLILGSIGSVLTFIFSKQLCLWAFGTTEYTTSFRMLAVVVFINQIYVGSQTILNGFRKIKEMAYISIIAGIIILIFTIPAYYFFKQAAIVPSLIFSALVYLLTSIFYSRKVKIISIPVKLGDIKIYGTGMLRFGFVSMIIGVFMLLSTYQLRILVNGELGLFYVGIYQAGWGLTASYVQLIFQAMSRDLSPRLNGVIDSVEETNKLVNEQLHITILISLPILSIMILFSSSIIHLLYSSEFYEAISLFQWLLFGTILRVFSRPLAFILYSARLTTLYLISELLPTVLLLILSYSLINFFGLDAIGIAYTISYVLYNIFIYITTRIKVDFVYDNLSKKCMAISGFGIMSSFILKYGFHSPAFLYLNIILCIGLSCWAFFYLNKLLGLNHIISNRIRKVFNKKTHK